MGARMILAGAVVGLLAAPAAAYPMAKSHYMNTYYCAGVAAAYGERLTTSEQHRGGAAKAQSVAQELARRAEAFGRRSGFQPSEGKEAEVHGRSTIGNLMPFGAAWQAGGAIPQEAFRQYQHCETLAEM